MKLEEIRNQYVEELLKELIGDDVNDFTKNNVIKTMKRIESTISIQRKQIEKTEDIKMISLNDIMASTALDMLLYPGNIRSLDVTFKNTEITNDIHVSREK